MIRVVRRRNGTINTILDYEVVNGEIKGDILNPKDTQILRWLLITNKNNSASAFQIMMPLGDVYIQYINLRLRTMMERYGIVYKPEWGRYKISAHFTHALQEAFDTDIIEEKDL